MYRLEWWHWNFFFLLSLIKDNRSFFGNFSIFNFETGTSGLVVHIDTH